MGWLRILNPPYPRIGRLGYTTKFTAIEPLRLELGGDWYASSVFALGPVLAMGISRTVSPPDEAGDPRWSAWLSAGLRIALDPAGH
ncbi:MAG: hypothetical protein QM784_15785 [Polyangiaceae bacterium]